MYERINHSLFSNPKTKCQVQPVGPKVIMEVVIFYYSLLERVSAINTRLLPFPTNVGAMYKAKAEQPNH